MWETMNVLKIICRQSVFLRSFSSRTNDSFSKDLLDIIVCPLSKEPLRLASQMILHFPKSTFLCSNRYDSNSQTLVNDKLGVAYPIKDGGIPALAPQDGYLLNSSSANPNKNE